MDLFAFPPLAALLDGGYSAVAALVALLDPLAGSASAAVAVVVITLLVRSLLIPVGITQRRAELGRLRIAPMIAELRRRHARTPEVLRRKMLELYSREHVSPIAGILPALAQAPVLSIVYALFAFPQANGHANLLLTARLGDAGMGLSFLHTLAVASAPGAWTALIPFAVLLVVAIVVAALARRTALRDAPVIAPGEFGPSAPAMLVRAVTWLPFAAVAVTALAPLAAALYLTTSSSWSLVERAMLRRRFPRVGP